MAKTQVKNPNAVALGRKGGSAKTSAQNEARKASLVAARAKRWPVKPEKS